MTSPASQLKILVCGDVRGRHESLFAKVGALNKSHGPFHALFCVGQFFGNDNDELQPYISSAKQIPIPTYFVCGNEPQFTLLQDENKELCTNLKFLGRSGIHDIAGLRVAFLSGVYQPESFRNADQPLSFCHYTRSDVKLLLEAPRSGFENGVDIFLSSEWPRNFQSTLSHPLPVEIAQMSFASVGSPIVSECALKLAPRYHFCGSLDCYFALPPYQNSQSRFVCHTTRLFALASVENEAKKKNLYACNLTPMTAMSNDMLKDKPVGSIPCPYLVKVESFSAADSDEPSLKRQKLQSAAFDPSKISHDSAQSIRWNMAPPPGYVCNRCHNSGHFIRDCPQKKDDVPADYVCKICNVPGHWIRDCQQKVDSSKPPVNYVCNLCQVPGHFISACPTRFESGDASSTIPPAGYLCKVCQVQGHWIKNCPKRQQLSNRADCWFCLGSKDAETHLVISVGDECYVALDKGPISPYHVLILPIAHLPYSTNFAASTLDEMTRFKKAIRDFFKTLEMDCVFVERHVPTKGVQHMHLQCFPVPCSKSMRIAEAFTTSASKIGINLSRADSTWTVSKAIPVGSYFVWIELPDESILWTCLDGNPGVSSKILQFGRETVASLIGKPERADWKVCKLDKDEEVSLTEQFKVGFRPFDPFA